MDLYHVAFLARSTGRHAGFFLMTESLTQEFCYLTITAKDIRQSTVTGIALIVALTFVKFIDTSTYPPRNPFPSHPHPRLFISTPFGKTSPQQGNEIYSLPTISPGTGKWRLSKKYRLKNQGTRVPAS